MQGTDIGCQRRACIEDADGDTRLAVDWNDLDRKVLFEWLDHGARGSCARHWMYDNTEYGGKLRGGYGFDASHHRNNKFNAAVAEAGLWWRGC